MKRFGTVLRYVRKKKKKERKRKTKQYENSFFILFQRNEIIRSRDQVLTINSERERERKRKKKKSPRDRKFTIPRRVSQLSVGRLDERSTWQLSIRGRVTLDTDNHRPLTDASRGSPVPSLANRTTVSDYFLSAFYCRPPPPPRRR